MSHFNICHIMRLIVLLWKVTASENTYHCIHEGSLTTNSTWHGYIASFAFINDARVAFDLSYPSDRCCQNILLYTSKEKSKVKPTMTCQQKEAILNITTNPVINLTTTYIWAGCKQQPNIQSIASNSSSNTTVRPTTQLECVGSRYIFAGGNSTRNWAIAVSNCASNSGLVLQYKLNITQYGVKCDGTIANEPNDNVNSTCYICADPQLLLLLIIISILMNA